MFAPTTGQECGSPGRLTGAPDAFDLLNREDDDIANDNAPGVLGEPGEGV